MITNRRQSRRVSNSSTKGLNLPCLRRRADHPRQMTARPPKGGKQGKETQKSSNRDHKNVIPSKRHERKVRHRLPRQNVTSTPRNTGLLIYGGKNYTVKSYIWLLLHRCHAWTRFRAIVDVCIPRDRRENRSGRRTKVTFNVHTSPKTYVLSVILVDCTINSDLSRLHRRGWWRRHSGSSTSSSRLANSSVPSFLLNQIMSVDPENDLI